MKKIIVIGFDVYNEKMYPHLYDILKKLEENFELTYIGEDDRGLNLARISAYINIALQEIKNKLEKFNFIKKKKSYESHYPVNTYKINLKDPRAILGEIYRGYKLLINSFIKNYSIRNNIKDLLSNNPPDIVIAIDSTALNCAAKFSKKNTKLIFWSHDYIPPDSKWYRYFLIRRLVKKNIKAIQKCSLIITQDSNRGAILDSIFHSHSIKKFFLPVSLKDDDFAREISNKKNDDFLKEKTIIMQISIYFERGSDLLIEAFQKLNSNVELHLQGKVFPALEKFMATK